MHFEPERSENCRSPRRTTTAAAGPSRLRGRPRASSALSAVLLIALVGCEHDDPRSPGAATLLPPQPPVVVETTGVVPPTEVPFALDLPLPARDLPTTSSEDGQVTSQPPLGAGGTRVAPLGSYMQVQAQLQGLLASQAEDAYRTAARLSAAGSGRWNVIDARDVTWVVDSICSGHGGAAAAGLARLMPGATPWDVPTQYEVLYLAIDRCPLQTEELSGQAFVASINDTARANAALSQRPVEAHIGTAPRQSVSKFCEWTADVAGILLQATFTHMNMRPLWRNLLDHVEEPVIRYFCPGVAERVQRAVG